ncbi:hypothetical protein HMPREF1208_01922 [Staphylococcus sp. HGB0015]|uniref:Uncharacterized protein n=1 Tax=Staphylococcus schleiferi TaxID=1295 RepID=A0A7Z7VWZ1_STASC|nr:hypothetical protein [Staphylococcus schleiferi]EPD49145.1 hypothetical protein HMPREF1208_01922 [Staphylococcus sp. HGB0015]NHA38464.1 hypothetical protein [Staphylococcus schleiferi]NHA40684.1 hypothetical protein [Staphylococcus schleiferi]NHA42968.1 hypothetical protein [Staphylococcus schleiferi]CAD7358844.1 Uncharacterised protein [Staphylococcus schleiferi]
MKFFNFLFVFVVAFLLADLGIIYCLYTWNLNLWVFVIPLFLLIFSLIYLKEYNHQKQDENKQ